MKKKLTVILLVAILAISFGACGGGEAEQEQTETQIVTIGATIAPHAEVLNEIKALMAEKGFTLEITEFTDYVLPNTAVENGELLANYFQHQPYLDDFNAQNGTHLVSVAAIHYEPFGIYTDKIASLDEIKDGDKIAVPNDTSNEARALQLLADKGLITLKEGVGLEATINDIVDNPKNIEIVEIEAAQLPRVLPDVACAVINGNYAIQGGFTVNDAIATEDKESVAAQTFANILVVKEGSEQDPSVLALIECLQSDTVRSFMEEKYQGSVVPMF